MVQTFAATSKKKYEVMGFEQIILPLYIVVFFFLFVYLCISSGYILEIK